MHESVQIDRTGFSGRGTDEQAERRVVMAIAPSPMTTRIARSYARGGGARRTITDPIE